MINNTSYDTGHGESHRVNCPHCGVPVAICVPAHAGGDYGIIRCDTYFLRSDSCYNKCHAQHCGKRFLVESRGERQQCSECGAEKTPIFTIKVTALPN